MINSKSMMTQLQWSNQIILSHPLLWNLFPTNSIVKFEDHKVLLNMINNVLKNKYVSQISLGILFIPRLQTWMVMHLFINANDYNNTAHSNSIQSNRGAISTHMALSTHLGRMTQICVSDLTIIGSEIGLSPGRRQAIIRTNAGILLTHWGWVRHKCVS